MLDSERLIRLRVRVFAMKHFRGFPGVNNFQDVPFNARRMRVKLILENSLARLSSAGSFLDRRMYPASIFRPLLNAKFSGAESGSSSRLTSSFRKNALINLGMLPSCEARGHIYIRRCIKSSVIDFLKFCKEIVRLRILTSQGLMLCQVNVGDSHYYREIHTGYALVLRIQPNSRAFSTSVQTVP